MPGLPPGPHLDLLLEALEIEAAAQRLLLAGDPAAAADGFRTAAERYAESYACAPPASYGRLIGRLKALVIAGDQPAARGAATEVLGLVALAEPTPPAAYAVALAALITGNDDLAVRSTSQMRSGGDAFGRAADAIDSIADGDGSRLQSAVRSIVADFEVRDHHLTGVPIADTALMFIRLGAIRGLEVRASSTLLPLV